MKMIINNILIIVFSLLSFACGDQDNNPEVTVNGNMISDVYIEQTMMLYENKNVTILGKGFKSGDILVLESGAGKYTTSLSDINANYASFYVPENLSDGKYNISVKRGERLQLLGTTIIKVSLLFDVPDKDNTTVKGVVFCGTKPVKGVRVSDGIETTVTNDDGFYWLNSDKSTKCVFYTIPSGYEPVSGNNITPGFWVALKQDKTVCEQHNFELVKVDNNKHIVLAAADFHLANRSSTKDIQQFRNGFLADVNKFVSENNGTRIYTLVLGDITWDRFWYSHNYDLFSYKTTMLSYPTPLFHVMGNHDNDPYIANDFGAEAAYRQALGPTYYSMDLGKVHYIMLDNTVFINDGGAQGTIGDRNYQKYLTENQLKWLKDDIAAIKSNITPIIVGFHCQTHKNNNELFVNTNSFSPASKRDEFMNCFSGFSNVHFLSGHTHLNATMVLNNNIIEHNTAAVSETWWWSGALSPQSICTDGTPSGYGVYQMNGTDVNWYYKGIGKQKGKQFRAYDMNVVKSFFGNTDIMNKLKAYDFRKDNPNDYITVEDNTVMLNIWNYDINWKISVKENGKELDVKRVFRRDPLHTITFDLPRVQNGEEPMNEWASCLTSHMFEVKTERYDSSLEIIVTDRFGNKYTENMSRPKAFTTTME